MPVDIDAFSHSRNVLFDICIYDGDNSYLTSHLRITTFGRYSNFRTSKTQGKFIAASLDMDLIHDYKD